MKNKRGFTLVECVIAMAIIMIISLCFYSLIMFANVSLQKSVITNKGLSEIENVVTIINCSDFESGGGGVVSLGDFESNLLWRYDNKIDLNKVNDYLYNFSYCVDEKGNFDAKGKGQYEFIIEIDENKVRLFANIYYKNQVVYNLSNPYVKVVRL
ncbi:MAG: prepilin-type N-terminal cleavage/methylation domain-containing protein [Christensenellales bacterium]